MSAGPVGDELPREAVSLAYRQAAIDGQLCGFGVSTSARRAAASARGLLFDFLREAAPLSPGRYPALTDRVARACANGDERALFPGQWIYPGASSASNSNGVASGPTRERAMASARFELIERDALLRAWYGLFASRPLTSGELARPALRTLRARAAAVGLDAQWFVLGGGRTRTVACVLSGARAPHLGLGSAARPSLEEAASKAFVEAAGSHLGQVLAHRELGARAFARLAARTGAGVAGDVHRRTFETFWAAQPVAAAGEIARRFSRPHVGASPRLPVSPYRWLDLTPRTAGHPHVVRVFHPDAAPLPNTMAQVRLLERLLGVRSDGVPPPIS